jgi:Tfp pilus assembly protein PilO
MTDVLMFIGAMVAAFTLFAGQYAIFFYQPRVEANGQATAERESLKRELAALETALEKKGELETQRALLASKLERLELFLPPVADIEGLRAAFEAQAERHGVSVSLTAHGEEVRKDFYGEIPLQLETEGPYTGTVAFLKDVDIMPRVERFGDLRVERVGPKRYRMRAALTVFRFLS